MMDINVAKICNCWHCYIVCCVDS